MISFILHISSDTNMLVSMYVINRIHKCSNMNLNILFLFLLLIRRPKKMETVLKPNYGILTLCQLLLVNKNSAEGYVTTAKSSFSPGLLYLPILLFYFGTTPQTTPVLLR